MTKPLNYPPTSSAEVTERVGLYFYSPSGSSLGDTGRVITNPVLEK
jgi:hypothetical protein